MKRLVLVRTVGRCARVPIRGYIRVGGGHSVAALAVPIRGYIRVGGGHSVAALAVPIRGRCARRSNSWPAGAGRQPEYFNPYSWNQSDRAFAITRATQVFPDRLE
jgi:hypothetical protein